MKNASMFGSTQNTTPLLYETPTLFYKNSALNILQLYFLTGFLANYKSLVTINNIILIILITLSIFYIKKKRSLHSPLIVMYGVLTSISIFNHLWWASYAGFPKGARTMLVTLLAMIACRHCAFKGLFKRSIFLNVAPFIFLIPIGSQVIGGRFYSSFLNENIHGSALPFAFALGINSLVDLKFSLKNISMLFPPLTLMFLSGRRSILVYFSLTTFVLLASRFAKMFWSSNNRLSKGINSRAKTILAITIILIMFGSLLSIMLEKQTERFGGDFQFVEHLSDLILGDAMDRSSLERRAFIDISFAAAEKNWLGYGNGNFPYVVNKYAPSYISLANNPHSGLAESLITAGYPGLLLYLLMLIYLTRIGWRDFPFWLCMIWMLLSVFVEANLSSRIIWPLLAIAEVELGLSNRFRNKSTNIITSRIRPTYNYSNNKMN